MISLALLFVSHVSLTYADEGISATLILTSNLSTVGDIVDLTVEVTHPAGYRLVPLDSALALGGVLNEAEILQPEIGHIGMMVSSAALQKVWQPLPHRRAGMKQIYFHGVCAAVEDIGDFLN